MACCIACNISCAVLLLRCSLQWKSPPSGAEACQIHRDERQESICKITTDFYSCLQFDSLDLWWMTWIAWKCRAEILLWLFCLPIASHFVFVYPEEVCAERKRKKNTAKYWNNNKSERRMTRRNENTLEMIERRETNIESLLMTLIKKTEHNRIKKTGKKRESRTNKSRNIPFEMSMNWVFNFDACAQWR